jgi:hypothetical protein
MSDSVEKKRVSLERDKVRRTTHWDLDYLSSREVEDLYAAKILRSIDEPRQDRSRKSMTNRQLGLLCMAAGLGLLGLAFAVARLMG